MKNQAKEKSKKIKINNHGFSVVILICFLVLVASIVVTCLESCNCHLFIGLKKHRDISNIVGVICQVVATVLCIILPVIGISFSLQTNKIFGIEIHKLCSMRVDLHFSYKASVIISVILVGLNLLFLFLNLIYMCLGITIITIIFCTYVLCVEIPYMSFKENAFKEILTNRFINDFESDDLLQNDFDLALRNIILEKSLEVAYSILSIKPQRNNNLKTNEIEINKKILNKLVDIQEAIGFELINYENEKDFSKTAERIRHSILYILNGTFDIFSILNNDVNDINNVETCIIRILFQLLKIEKQSKQTAELFASSLIFRNYDNNKEQLNNMFISVMIILVAETVKAGNFVLLEALRKEFSLYCYSLEEKKQSTVFFAIISFFLYYLCEKEGDTSVEMKEKINKFINFGGVVDNVCIISWKKLFKSFSDNFNVSYNDFINYYNKNEHYLEFMNYSSSMHYVVLTPEFATNWFLAILLNRDNLYNYDYGKELSLLAVEKGHYFIKEFKRKNYDDNTFKPSDSLLEALKFYGIDNDPFATFNILEERTHSFLNFIDGELLKDIENDTEESSEVNIEEIAVKFNEALKSLLNSEWGYNSKINVSDSPSKFLNLIDEKKSKAINHDEAITNGVIRSIWYELSGNTPKEVIYKTSTYLNQIKDLIEKEIQFVTDGAFYEAYSIKDSELREKYEAKIKNTQKIKSHILSGTVFVLKNGFSFNCQIINVKASELSVERLNAEIDKYKRVDGQYVYEGIFMPREKVARFIKERYYLLQFEVKYKISTYPGSIIELDLYSGDTE